MKDSQPSDDTNALKLQLELEKLDRRWVEEKQTYSARACGDLQGRWSHTPVGPIDPGFVLIGGLAIIALGVMWLRDSGHPGSSNRGLFLVVAGVATIAIAGAMLRAQIRNRKAYNEARQRYESQRQQLLHAIEACSGETTRPQSADQGGGMRTAPPTNTGA